MLKVEKFRDKGNLFYESNNKSRKICHKNHHTKIEGNDEKGNVIFSIHDYILFNNIF